MEHSFKIRVGWVVLMLVTSTPTAFAAVVGFAILSNAEFDQRQITVVIEVMLSEIFCIFFGGKGQ